LSSNPVINHLSNKGFKPVAISAQNSETYSRALGCPLIIALFSPCQEHEAASPTKDMKTVPRLKLNSRKTLFSRSPVRSPAKMDLKPTTSFSVRVMS
jgi:hypothetical protein